MPAVPDSALDLIGATPVVRLRGFDTGPCELFLKLESQNPGGSIKDRVGRSMVAAAERDGRLYLLCKGRRRLLRLSIAAAEATLAAI